MCFVLLVRLAIKIICIGLLVLVLLDLSLIGVWHETAKRLMYLMNAWVWRSAALIPCFIALGLSFTLLQ